MNFAHRFFDGMRAALGVVGSLFCCSGGAVADMPKDAFFGLEAQGIDGDIVKFSSYKGLVVLVVNTASKCGFTSQYEGLESLYQKYKEKGFVVFGFPSNDYMSQEPGENEDIKTFCSLNFGVSFPLFAKGSVKGEKKQPVYKFLTEQSERKFAGDPGWNFVKFLIGRNGEVVGRFSSMTAPGSQELIASVESALLAELPPKE